jgi:hypothetical protein
MCLQSRNTYNVKSLKQRKSFELFCQVINIRGVLILGDFLDII